MKNKRITTCKRLWCKIRYWQNLNDVSNDDLARILGVSTRTLLSYDKNSENITLKTIDNFLFTTNMDLEMLYNL